MKTLVLLDCQLDYVTGPLSVKKKGKDCVERTKIFINRNKDEISKVVFKCVLHQPDCSIFKRNGGELPQHCVIWTPGACIEPTILKLLWRLNIPYEVVTSYNALNKSLEHQNDIVFAGMNGDTTLYSVVKNYWNIKQCSIFWPGTFFLYHNENTLNYLRSHTEGIFEVPKRDVKKDLFVQRVK